jgi:hypothetical protein
MNKLIVGLVCSIVLLAGCKVEGVESTGTMDMIVNKVDMFSQYNSTVDLADLNTGKVYTKQRLECSTERAFKIEVGTVWDVQYKDIKKDGVVTRKLVDVRRICDRSQ